jgi:hypothetical protein
VCERIKNRLAKVGSIMVPALPATREKTSSARVKLLSRFLKRGSIPEETARSTEGRDRDERGGETPTE